MSGVTVSCEKGALSLSLSNQRSRESFGTGQRELRLRYEIHGFQGF